MAQADGVVANGTGSAVRSDINNQYAALWSNHSGSTEPSSGKVAYQFWADTNTNILKIRNSANNAWINLFTLAGGIDVDAASNFNEDVTFTGASYNLVWDKSDNALEFADNAKCTFGAGDLSLYHDGTHSYIDNSTNTLKIRGDLIRLNDKTNDHAMLKAEADGTVEIFHDNVKRFETTSAGCTLTGSLTGTGHVYLPDGGKFVSGASNDLQIYHDGTNSFIHNDTGTLNVQSDSYLYLESDNRVYIGNVGMSEVGAVFVKDGAVELYYSGTKTFETISGGIKLTGRNFETGSVSATGSSTGIKHNTWNNNEIGIAMSHQSTAGQTFFTFYNPNGNVGYIQSSGSATIYSTSSDYRLKENEVAISDGITRVKQLKPYRFNFKKDPSTTVDGFFAHEAQTVVPEAVTGTKDEVATKDEGERKIGDPIMQGIDQSKFVPLLTAALQEAIAKIETLETKVAALEAK